MYVPGVQVVVFHPTAHYFVIASGNDLSLWAPPVHEINDENRVLALHIPDALVSCAAFHPHSPLLAVGGQFGWNGSKQEIARLYRLSPDFTQTQSVLKIEDEWGDTSSVAFHPSAHYLLTGCLKVGAKLWKLTPDCTAATCVSTFRTNVRCLAFHHSGRCLATGNDDCTAKLWL